MKQHFVIFYSPGTFVSEADQRPIDSWDVKQATELAHEIHQRHGATPFGFCFITRTRLDDELDSHETERSGMYYLGGKIETLSEVEARNDPKEATLLANMRGNNIDKIIVNTNSYRFTGPFNDGDVLLNFTPNKKAATT
jgi:hypothetical protein